MKVIILGATGFLGKNLVQYLLKHDHEVYCVVRSEQSIGKLSSLEGELFFWNIDEVSSDRICEAGIEVAYNLSCRYIDSDTTDADIIAANLSVPSDFLSSCIHGGVERFISIGTGLPDTFNIYTITKAQFNRLGEFYAAEWERKGKPFQFVNVELERFYGEGEPINRFIPSMIIRLLNNETLLLTAGDQKRDFVYIKDVLRILENLISVEMPVYLDLPLGSGEGPTVREVMEYLHAISGSASEMQFGAVEKRFHEPDSVADLTLLSQYGMRIQYGWQDGMKKLMDYYKNSEERGNMI